MAHAYTWSHPLIKEGASLETVNGLWCVRSSNSCCLFMLLVIGASFGLHVQTCMVERQGKEKGKGQGREWRRGRKSRNWRAKSARDEYNCRSPWANHTHWTPSRPTQNWIWRRSWWKRMGHASPASQRLPWRESPWPSTSRLSHHHHLRAHQTARTDWRPHLGWWLLRSYDERPKLMNPIVHLSAFYCTLLVHNNSNTLYWQWLQNFSGLCVFMIEGQNEVWVCKKNQLAVSCLFCSDNEVKLSNRPWTSSTWERQKWLLTRYSSHPTFTFLLIPFSSSLSLIPPLTPLYLLTCWGVSDMLSCPASLSSSTVSFWLLLFDTCRYSLIISTIWCES